MTAQLYVCGDVHQPGGCETAFDRWLDQLMQRPPAHLVILGDLFDVWHETASEIERHALTITRLHTLQRRGWRMDFVQGNRELTGRRCLAVTLGMPVHWPNVVVQVGPRRVRIVHGDRLCHDPGYHFFATLVRSFWFQAAGRCLPTWTHDLFGKWCRGRSRNRRQRESGQRGGASVVRLTPARLRGAAKGVDTVIGGHIHQHWRRCLLGIDTILVGDWDDHSGTWVEGFADGRLELKSDHEL